jgi:hypothetical protein
MDGLSTMSLTMRMTEYNMNETVEATRENTNTHTRIWHL